MGSPEIPQLSKYAYKGIKTLPDADNIFRGASERRCFIGIDSPYGSSFREFCNTKFSLRERAHKLTDSRQKPQITTGQIYQGILLGGIFRKRSFLQIDQFLREKEVKKFIGSKRMQVASDTTLPRILTGLGLTQLRNLNYLIYGRAKQNGLLRLKNPLFADLRIGVVDGSCLGGIFWATGFELLGDPPVMLDFEPMANKGKELPTSSKLFNRLKKRFGKGFIDLVLVDGLYVSQRHINQYIRANIDVLIKTDEVRLNIIEDAEGIFNQWGKCQDDVAYEKGVDEQRAVEYEIWSASGFRLEGVESKRIWTHDEDVWLRLFWIQIMAFGSVETLIN